MIYVLRLDNPLSLNDTGMPTSVRLIGPFDTEDSASDWATSPANNLHDNPCWQLVDLDTTTVAVETP